MSRATIFKRNTIALAKHHKKHCDGENCNISLMILRHMAQDAGVKFTEKQLELFI